MIFGASLIRLGLIIDSLKHKRVIVKRIFETQKAQKYTKGFHKRFLSIHVFFISEIQASFVKAFCVFLCLLCFKKKSGTYLNKCLLFFIPFCFLACQNPNKQQKTNTHLGFYHWKTALELSSTEIAYLDALQAEKLYIKFFDVDWDFNQKKPKPLASLQVKTIPPKEIAIVPTIFITNRTFQHIKLKHTLVLGEQIVAKLKEQFKAFPAHTVQQIQLDCDWSGTTKEKYFSFLKFMQEELQALDIELSVTIRLHQVKYFEKTGVPPVKRGLLMFYNMGEVMAPSTENSILDLAIAKQYTASLADYPLPLDLGLPLFRWGVLFRHGKMIQLINQLAANSLVDTTRFLKKDSTHYTILKGTYLDGLYLYEADEIRLEAIQMKNLIASIELLRPYFENTDFDLLFYHLDEGVIEGFNWEGLKELRIEN